MITLTQRQLGEVKRLGAAAPPGEWTSARDRFTGKWLVFGEDGDSFAVVNEALGHGVTLCHAQETAAYIVAARAEVVLAMVELIAEWKKALENTPCTCWVEKEKEHADFHVHPSCPQLVARAALALLKE